MRRRILCAITVAVSRAGLVAKSCGCSLRRWHRAKLAFHRARINRYQQNALDSVRFHLTGRCRFLCSRRPVRLRCFREALRWQDGMRRPAGLLPCKQTPGRRPATPPFRHYERNVRTHQCETKGTAHVHRPTVSPRRARSQQPSRWSAERRASPMRRKAPSDSAFTRVFVALCACGPTSLARRRVPLHPSACRRSAPLALS